MGSKPALASGVRYQRSVRNYPLLRVDSPRVALLMDFASASARFQEVAPLLSLIAERANQFFAIERMTLLLCDENRQNLRTIAIGDFGWRSLSTEDIPVSDMGLILEALLTETSTRSSEGMSAPMSSAGRIVGVLCVAAGRSQYTIDDLKLLHFLADYLAGTFERLMLGSELFSPTHKIPFPIDASEIAITQTPAVLRQISYLAQHDVLTNLPNRALLNERLSRALALSRRYERRFAVLFLDLDRFKDINDSFGHAIGDEVLRRVSDRLVACVRSSDTVSRIGGDEFVILLTELKDESDATICSGNIIAAVAAPLNIADHEFHLMVSVGISIFPRDGDTEESLINSADVSMYRAKREGHEKCR